MNKIKKKLNEEQIQTMLIKKLKESDYIKIDGWLYTVIGEVDPTDDEPQILLENENNNDELLLIANLIHESITFYKLTEF